MRKFTAPVECATRISSKAISLTYSERATATPWKKRVPTKGWTFTIFEEAFNQGYPQELKHFIDCVREDKPPIVTGEDGRAVLELIYATYASAGMRKKVELPFAPKNVKKPVTCGRFDA
jgi:predicted dehydrogenase